MQMQIQKQNHKNYTWNVSKLKRKMEFVVFVVVVCCCKTVFLMGCVLILFMFFVCLFALCRYECFCLFFLNNNHIKMIIIISTMFFLIWNKIVVRGVENEKVQCVCALKKAKKKVFYSWGWCV